MRITNTESCGLVIDVQERLHPHMQDADALAARIVVLIKGLRELAVPILVTEQYPKGLGPTIPSVRQALPDPDPVEKIYFSCLDESVFVRRLQALSRRQVILAGIEAHVCVCQTALDLLTAGLTPVIVADCVSSRSAYDKEIALQRLRSAGAVVTTAEALLFELCVRAGTDRFKAISRLVK